MRARTWMIIRIGISLALALLLAGCFIDAGSLPTPAAPGGGIALVVTDVIQPTAEMTPEALPFDDVTDEPTPEALPTEGLPFDDVTQEVSVEATPDVLPTVEELPLFPSETPTATFVVFPTATQEAALIPPSETPFVFPSETPTATFVVFPTATQEAALIPPSEMPFVFPSETPTATFVVFPTATQDAGLVAPTDAGQGGSTDALPTSTPIGSESDLIAMVLATATRVTSLYNQSVGGQQPAVPPVIAGLTFPLPPPPALPAACPGPSRVSINQAIGNAPFTVQVQVLDANPDFSYTWSYRVDTTTTILVTAAGSSATFTINQPGTYELLLQARFAPGKELGGTEACLRTWVVTQKLTVQTRAR